MKIRTITDDIIFPNISRCTTARAIKQKIAHISSYHGRRVVSFNFLLAKRPVSTCNGIIANTIVGNTKRSELLRFRVNTFQRETRFFFKCLGP